MKKNSKNSLAPHRNLLRIAAGIDVSDKKRRISTTNRRHHCPWPPKIFTNTSWCISLYIFYWDYLVRSILRLSDASPQDSSILSTISYWIYEIYIVNVIRSLDLKYCTKSLVHRVKTTGLHAKYRLPATFSL